MLGDRKLSNASCALEPLENRHRDALAKAGASPSIWLLQSFNIAEGFDRYFDWMLAEKEAGRWFPFAVLDPAGEVAGYSRITVWPEHSSAELAGAVRADLQGKGQGASGMAHTFGWIFESLGVRLMCLTAALDNVRSQKGIDAAGFRRMGEREAVRPDGTTRRSVYWELTRDEWRQRHRL